MAVEGSENGYSMIATSDGEFVIAGNTYTTGYSNVYLLKIHANGALNWNLTLPATRDDYGYSMVEANDGGLVVAGYTYNGDNEDILLLKTYANGTLCWNQTYGGSNQESGHAVVATS